MPRPFFFGLLALVLSAGAAATHASTLTVLYNFCSQSDCVDGQRPGSLLVEDTPLPGGPVIYGVTAGGGAYDDGIAFELDPNGDGSYTEHDLYDFVCSGSFDCPGINPSGLVVGSDGNFYGTTFGGPGGSITTGTFFELVPGSPQYTEYTLQRFTQSCGYSANGLIALSNLEFVIAAEPSQPPNPSCEPFLFRWSPSGGKILSRKFIDFLLVANGKGDLFGTQPGGGANNKGEVFKLAPDGSGGVLYSFCSETNCADGAVPNGALLRGPNGALYGTTRQGGKDGEGVVFRLRRDGKYRVLHSFCRRGAGSGCPKGETPSGNLVMDAAGNIYGTASNPKAGGVIFELVRSEASGRLTYGEQVLWTGVSPLYLAIDGSGNLYGTMFPGDNDGGAVFELTP